jgi:ATP phosphoribosyltransferase regulatory subunit
MAQRPIQPFYPVGVRPLLMQEAARRRQCEQTIDAVLARRGFQEVILPIIDFSAPYDTLADDGSARRRYRFVDRDGELIAIRSDFTPMVARAVAPLLPSLGVPLRLFYRGDVVRCEPSRLGRSRELFQAGAELVGDRTPDADVEIIRVAAEVLSKFGIRPTVLFTDVSLVPRLFDFETASAAVIDSITRAFRNRSAAGATALEAALDADRAAVLPKLIDGSATLSDLEQFDAIGSVVERLTTIQDSLRGADVKAALTFGDLPGDIGYYTSLRFEILDASTRRLLGSGGRYDDLYAAFGAPSPAVGFTINVDAIEEVAP